MLHAILKAAGWVGETVVAETLHSHDAKNNTAGLPNPNSIPSNPLKLKQNQWKQTETNQILSTQTSLSRLQLKLKSGEPGSPIDVEDKTAKSDQKATAKPGIWDELKRLKADGFLLLIREIVRESKKGLVTLQAQMNETQKNPPTTKAGLLTAVNLGIDVSYKIVELTNKLAVYFETIQEEITKGGLKLNDVLTMSEDRSDRGVYALMQEGVKEADKFIMKMDNELSLYMSAVSKKIDQVCTQQSVATSKVTMSAPPANRFAKKAGTKPSDSETNDEVASDDETDDAKAAPVKPLLAATH